MNFCASEVKNLVVQFVRNSYVIVKMAMKIWQQVFTDVIIQIFMLLMTWYSERVV